jgi:glycosyltransferase involved in cell wall biosynthesis
MTLKPVITIGITTYDREDFLVKAIKSVVNQEFSNWKLIVSNDNPKRFLSLANLGISEDIRINIVNQPTNLGEIANLNWLMNSAESEYFTWLADDDLMHPDYLKILLKEIIRFPKTNAIFSNFEHGGEPKKAFYEVCVSPFVEIIDQSDFLLRYSSRNLYLVGVYGIFRLSSLQEIGGIPSLGSGFSPGSDNLLPILLSKNSRILYTNAKLIFFRTHAGSLSNSSDDLKSYLSAEKEFMKILGEVTLQIPIRERNRIHRSFISWFLDNHLTVIHRHSNLRFFHKFKALVKIDLAILRGANTKLLVSLMNYLALAKSIVKFFNRAIREKLLKILK